jgi:hypothetical protein
VRYCSEVFGAGPTSQTTRLAPYRSLASHWGTVIRSATPAWAGVASEWSMSRNPLAVSRSHQPPCHASCTRTKSATAFFLGWWCERLSFLSSGMSASLLGAAHQTRSSWNRWRGVQLIGAGRREQPSAAHKRAAAARRVDRRAALPQARRGSRPQRLITRWSRNVATNATLLPQSHHSWYLCANVPGHTPRPDGYAGERDGALRRERGVDVALRATPAFKLSSWSCRFSR